jgi:hypothetical protein
MSATHGLAMLTANLESIPGGDVDAEILIPKNCDNWLPIQILQSAIGLQRLSGMANEQALSLIIVPGNEMSTSMPAQPAA